MSNFDTTRQSLKTLNLHVFDFILKVCYISNVFDGTSYKVHKRIIFFSNHTGIWTHVYWIIFSQTWNQFPTVHIITPAALISSVVIARPTVKRLCNYSVKTFNVLLTVSLSPPADPRVRLWDRDDGKRVSLRPTFPCMNNLSSSMADKFLSEFFLNHHTASMLRRTIVLPRFQRHSLE